jgi:hypothetical protein
MPGYNFKLAMAVSSPVIQIKMAMTASSPEFKFTELSHPFVQNDVFLCI